jgi:hypothetical protein
MDNDLDLKFLAIGDSGVGKVNNLIYSFIYLDLYNRHVYLINMLKDNLMRN